MNLLDLFLISFERGGPVMWPILIVSLVVWIIGFDKLFAVRRLVRGRNRFIKAVDSGQNALTGSVEYDRLLAAVCSAADKQDSVSYIFRQFLLETVPRLDSGFSTMSAWISSAPLLGLLGTVSGMIHTFKSIMEFGIGNPHLMAEGISIALLTTQAGLTVAFPAMLFHNYLLNRKNMLVNSIVHDGEELSKKFDN